MPTTLTLRLRRMRPWVPCAALLLLAALTPCCMVGQSESASVSGRVTDQQNAVIPNVEVEIRNVDTNSTEITKTNGDGIYSFPSLKPGNYVMSVRKEQFQTVSVTGITLHVQDSLSRNFALQIGSSAVSITVRADGINMNTTDGSVSTIVDRQFVENMPLNGRSFQALITLAPGVSQVPTQVAGVGYSGEITVNGQRTEANYFTVDGVSANTGVEGNANAQGAGFSGSVAGETALGTTQSLVSIDALQEFRATTSTFSAEYGRSPGGQFSFVTRSGTNEFHGLLFEYFRNEALDAANWFNGYTNNPPLPKAAERQNDFGGTFGGPLLIPRLSNKKRPTFFFFSYEGLRLKTPQTTTAQQYPDIDLRKSAPSAIQPVLNAFPVPNGADLGNGLGLFNSSYSNPASLDSVSIRVDHTFSDDLSIFGRYSHAPSNSDIRSTQNLANLNSSIQNIDTVTLGATYVITPRVSDQLRFNYTGNTGRYNLLSDNFGGAHSFDINTLNLPQFSSVSALLLFGQESALSAGPSENRQKQFNVVDTLAAILGRHVLKVGIDYRHLATLAHPYANQQEYVFLSLSSVQDNQPDFVIVNTAPIQTEPIFTNFSAFAQDEWRLNSRLALSLGLRWELNPPPGDGYGNIPYTLNQISDLVTASLAPKGTPLWQTTYHNFGPRLGLAYTLRDHTGWEAVVRGGAGIFYDTGNVGASQGTVGVGYRGFGFLSSSAAYPLRPDQWELPPPSIVPPYQGQVYAFASHLKTPYTMQWNLAVEQALGAKQSLILNYVGSGGREQLLGQYYQPGQLGNPNFTSSGYAYITRNRPNSEYNALQAKYQRQLSRGLQALVSYTWSHSIDETSTNFTSFDILRGDSDFDIRHNLQAAVTYDIPWGVENRLVRSIFSNWSVDGRLSARTALPVDINATQAVAPDGSTQNLRANLVPGQPLYLYGSQYPGGQIINYNAFIAPTAAQQAAGDFGDAPRNFLRGFGAVQLDTALQRRFGVTDRLNLVLRAEAFNVLNHPNFGTIDNNLTDGQGVFGYAKNTLNAQLGGLNPLYQTGGPRSLQMSLRLAF